MADDGPLPDDSVANADSVGVVDMWAVFQGVCTQYSGRAAYRLAPGGPHITYGAFQDRVAQLASRLGKILEDTGVQLDATSDAMAQPKVAVLLPNCPQCVAHAASRLAAWGALWASLQRVRRGSACGCAARTPDAF